MVEEAINTEEAVLAPGEEVGEERTDDADEASDAGSEVGDVTELDDDVLDRDSDNEPGTSVVILDEDVNETEDVTTVTEAEFERSCVVSESVYEDSEVGLTVVWFSLNDVLSTTTLRDGDAAGAC